MKALLLALLLCVLAFAGLRAYEYWTDHSIRMTREELQTGMSKVAEYYYLKGAADAYKANAEQCEQMGRFGYEGKRYSCSALQNLKL